MLKSYYSKFDFTSVSDKELCVFLENYKKDVKVSNKPLKTRLLDDFLIKLISSLCKRNKYKEVVAIVEFLGERFCLKNPKICFDVGYSFVSEKKPITGEKFYLEYLSKYPDNHATLNNLGLIYEERGDFELAKDYIGWSLDQPEANEINKNNFDRVEQKLVQEFQKEKDFQLALNSFKRENSYIFDKVSTFYANATPQGKIVCPYRLLPKYIGAKTEKANELIDQWLNKNYVKKLEEKDEETGSTCYKINAYIKDYIRDNQEIIKKEQNFLKMAESLNLESLEKIGYTEELQKNLDYIENETIREIVKRDFYCLALLIVLDIQKPSLIAGGSIIEAILLDLHEKQNINKIVAKNSKNKNLYSGDLLELINSGLENQLIEEHIYHLCNGIRGFRNLVHPGAEYRKEDIDVSHDSVQIVRTIVKMLIRGIGK